MIKKAFLYITLSLMCTACTIEDEVSKEALINKEPISLDTQYQNSFLKFTSRCILGDMSVFDVVNALYIQSNQFEDNPLSLVLLSYENTKAFEKCLQKAYNLGNKQAYKNMHKKAANCSLIAKKFYAKKDYTNGGFWMQRVLNLLGEKKGFEVLGRDFIEDEDTLELGALMLEQAARLGNTSARDLLVSYSTPNTVEYNSIK